jgi:hypothetical protein
MKAQKALEGGKWSKPHPRKEPQYPLYGRLGGPRGWSGWQQKILPPTRVSVMNYPAHSKSLYWLPSPHMIYLNYKLISLYSLLIQLCESFPQPKCSIPEHCQPSIHSFISRHFNIWRKGHKYINTVSNWHINFHTLHTVNHWYNYWTKNWIQNIHGTTVVFYKWPLHEFHTFLEIIIKQNSRTWQ